MYRYSSGCWRFHAGNYGAALGAAWAIRSALGDAIYRGTPTAPSAIVIGPVTAASTIDHALVPFIKRHCELSNRKRFRDRHPNLGFIKLSFRLVCRGRPHKRMDVIEKTH
jgi:hypothetical protein